MEEGCEYFAANETGMEKYVCMYVCIKICVSRSSLQPGCHDGSMIDRRLYRSLSSDISGDRD